MADVRCGSCGEQVPAGRFCVRCGAHLGDAPESAAPSRKRSQFAAAPHESVHRPALISSLFPHLPRRSMRGFRVSLAGGAALVLVLGLLRLFPVGLIAGAVLLPLLTLLYLWDTDVYEDEPMQVIILTMVWGAVAGVITGAIGQALTGSVASLVPDQGKIVLDQGIIVPLIGVVLSLLGPLALLRYRRFNDVLDGVAFGAAAGASFAAGEVITYSFSILSGGLRPAGSILPEVGRLATIAIAIPVLEMAVIASVSAALWLHFRAPVRDRSALGVLGNPLIALAVGAVLIAVGFSLEPLMAVGWWLLCLAALDVVGLLWLRRIMQLGLLEESAEIPIGPPITCANCGEQTPRHTFCINCGVSLQALPKAHPSRHPAPGSSPGVAQPSGASPTGGLGVSAMARTEWRGGEHHSRNPQLRIVLVFGALCIVLSAIAVGIAALSAPPGVAPVCTKPGCAAPPRGPSPGGIGTTGSLAPPVGRVLSSAGGQTGAAAATANAAPALTGAMQTYTNPGLGYTFEYPQGLTVGSSNGNQVVLINGAQPDFIVYVTGRPAPGGTAQAVQQSIVSALGRSIPNLAPVSSSNALAIPAAELGGHAGVGGFYQGYLDSPNGPQTPVDLAILVASDGQAILGVAVESLNPNATQGRMGLLDQTMLDSFRFAGDIVR